MSADPRVILFRVGGLGDVFVALPAISLARRSLPGFRLTLVGRLEYAAVFKQAGIVDEIMALDDSRIAGIFGHDERPDSSLDNKQEGKPTGSFSGLESKALGKSGGHPAIISDGWSESGVAQLAGYDLALGWLNRRGDWPSDDSWARLGIKQTFFASYAVGSAVPMSRFFFDRTREFFARSRAAPLPISPRPHVRTASGRNSDDLLALVDPNVSNPDALFDDCARLTLPASLKKTALGRLGLSALGKNGRRVVVHPGSGGRAKRWPLARFLEVIRHAATRGLEGVLVTGEAEADDEPRLRKVKLPAGWTWASRLPAETLTGLLAASTHYLGNDSGPTHLAAACGASVLALFRDENLPAWRPFGRTRVISAASVSGIPLDAVLAAFDELLTAREPQSNAA
jgi:ADP-heptose:LPS heptosyltransferase